MNSTSPGSGSGNCRERLLAFSALLFPSGGAHNPNSKMHGVRVFAPNDLVWFATCAELDGKVAANLLYLVAELRLSPERILESAWQSRFAAVGVDALMPLGVASVSDRLLLLGPSSDSSAGLLGEVIAHRWNGARVILSSRGIDEAAVRSALVLDSVICLRQFLLGELRGHGSILALRQSTDGNVADIWSTLRSERELDSAIESALAENGDVFAFLPNLGAKAEIVSMLSPDAWGTLQEERSADLIIEKVALPSSVDWIAFPRTPNVGDPPSCFVVCRNRSVTSRIVDSCAAKRAIWMAL